MFSALKTQVPRQAKKRFGVYPKACFQGKKKENAYTPKSLQGVCGGPLRAVLVYRFWPPKNVKFRSDNVASERTVAYSMDFRVDPKAKCSESRDLTAIAICDSNRESQITSDLRQCEPCQKSSLF